jgi:hypothetical protein
MDEIATRPDEFGCGISSSQATGFGDYSQFPDLNKVMLPSSLILFHLLGRPLNSRTSITMFWAAHSCYEAYIMVACWALFRYEITLLFLLGFLGYLLLFYL